MPVSLSKKKKFIADGVFFSELTEFLSRELSEDGFSKVEIRKTLVGTELIIKTTRTQAVIGVKGRRIRELTALIKKRFHFGENKVKLYVEKVFNRGLCANAQAETLRYKILKGLPIRRACYSVIRSTMESGAKGCMVTVSGKLRAQRAKTMKFMDGYMIHSGHPVNEYIQTSVRHCSLQQGVIGIKISIMLPWDSTGLMGPKRPLPDVVTVFEKKGLF